MGLADVNENGKFRTLRPWRSSLAAQAAAPPSASRRYICKRMAVMCVADAVLTYSTLFPGYPPFRSLKPAIWLKRPPARYQKLKALPSRRTGLPGPDAGDLLRHLIR